MLVRPTILQRDGTHLALLDFGGNGPPALLLHGLAGYAGEWSETATSLVDRARVLALDMRGHGRSERSPNDISRAAHVDDVTFVIDQLELKPVVLVGQSLGGHTALLVAAARPDLVRALVIVDASPGGLDDAMASRAAADLGKALQRWPVPFGSREAAVKFFGGSLMGEAWADGLEARDGGWWPRFDVDVMERTLREAIRRSYWAEWAQIRCPTLIVRAGHGKVDPADARDMVDRLPQARLVELPGAAHDLHLDRPTEWRAALNSFLDSIDGRAPNKP